MTNSVDYFAVYNEHVKTHPKLAVLYHEGDFYHMYEYIPEDKNSNENLSFLQDNSNSRSIGNAFELAGVLNMICQLEFKNKPHSITNRWTVGFPIGSIEKNGDTLKRNGYTLVFIEQMSKGPKPERKVTKVVTPACNLEITQKNKTNTILCILVDFQKYGTTVEKYEDYEIITGLSLLDITTGKSIICESYSKENNRINAVQDIYRFIITQRPAEILLYIQDLPNNHQAEYSEYLKTTLKVEASEKFNIYINSVPKEYPKISYQEAYFSKLFPNEVNQGVSILSNLDLERYTYGRISFMLLCQYCYETDPEILSKVYKPDLTWLDTNKHCILTHNTIEQLDILPNSTSGNKSNRGNKIIDSLLAVVDNTSTGGGKRMLINRLLNPILDVKELNQYYDMVEELITTYNDVRTSSLLIEFEKCLKKCGDLDKLHKKLSSKKILPTEFVKLYNTYIEILNICNLIYQSEQKTLIKFYLEVFGPITDQFYSFINIGKEYINFDLLQNAKLKDKLLLTSDQICISDQTGISYFQQINEIESYLTNVCNHLNSIVGRSHNALIDYAMDKSEDENNKDDVVFYYAIYATQAKANILKAKLSQVDKSLCGNLTFTTFKKKVVIKSDIINNKCQSLEIYKRDYAKYLYNYYLGIINYVIENINIFENVSNFVSSVDYIKSNAKTALKYNYFKPVIDYRNDHSFLEVEELRHPIIERIIPKEYITNDISLGNNVKGILLFGVNSSGKSSLAKSLGCMIIMAQAGMFVAGKLKYSPYHKIITRLSGSDNILQGESSFVVEMSELRTILRNKSPHTLVLGDELCRGTDTNSATGLTIATLDELLEENVSFIFCTHLHNIVTYPEVKKLTDPNENNGKCIKVAHIDTYFEKESDRLIYIRKLQPGSGSSSYGIEVAKWLGIDDKFIKKAEKIRKRKTDDSNEFLSTKKSKYNSMIYIDECELCHSKIQLQTHHLQHQKDADEQGFVGTYHKNSSFNLMVLCEECHVKLHSLLKEGSDMIEVIKQLEKQKLVEM